MFIDRDEHFERKRIKKVCVPEQTRQRRTKNREMMKMNDTQDSEIFSADDLNHCIVRVAAKFRIDRADALREKREFQEIVNDLKKQCEEFKKVRGCSV